MKKAISLLVVFVMILSLMSVASFSAIATAIDDGQPHFTYNTSTDDGSLGVWWWNNANSKNVTARDTRLNFLQNNHVTEIYLSASGMSYDEIASFIRAAGSRGMRVAWLSGDASWINNNSFNAFYNQYNAYQSQAAADAKFYAMHLDVEPHLIGSNQQNWQAYANLVVSAGQMMHNAGYKIEWDILFWLDEWSVSYKGSSTPLLNVLAQNADTLCVMSYRDTASAILDVASQEIPLGTNCKIILGVETYSTEANYVSFREEGKVPMYTALNSVMSTLAGKSTLTHGYGCAIHHVETWMSLDNGSDSQGGSQQGGESSAESSRESSAVNAGLVVSADKVSGYAGETVEVNFVVEKNSGFFGISLDIVYDPSLLTLKSLEFGSAFKDDGIVFTKVDANTGPSVIRGFVDDTVDRNCTVTGVLATATFMIAADAPEDAVADIQIKFDYKNQINADGENVPTAVNNGSVTVWGDDWPVFDKGLVIAADQVTGNPGEVVEVNFVLKQNGGFDKISFDVYYNTSILYLKSLKFNSSFMEKVNFSSVSKGAQPFSIEGETWLDSCKRKGVIATATFTIAPSAAEGTVADIILIADPDSNRGGDSYDELPVTVNDGFVHIPLPPAVSGDSEESELMDDIVYGDVDGDSEVTMKDVLKVRKAIAGLGGDNNETAADVNADHSVDMKDVLLMRKFIAGLIESFGIMAVRPPKTLTETLQEATEGDIISFGSYEQDNNPANGQEPIEWIVLDKQNDKALIISRYVLSKQKYHSDQVTVHTWSDCLLRDWLNETFLNQAFSMDEQRWIRLARVTADSNPVYSTPPGDNTVDMVYLLSINEANKYFDSYEDRVCYYNKYIAARWWLRSPGDGFLSAAIVDSNGSIDYRGLEFEGYRWESAGYTSYDVYVRPALWVNIPS